MRGHSPDHPDVDVTHGHTDNHSAEDPQMLEEEDLSEEDHPREDPQEEHHLEGHLEEDHLEEGHPKEGPCNQPHYHTHS
jgi:hypothetical protein